MKLRLRLFGGTPVPCPNSLAPAIALRRSHATGKFGPFHAWAGPRFSKHFIEIKNAVRPVCNRRVWHSLVTDQHGQSARIDAAYPYYAARAQPLIKVLTRPEIGGRR